MLLLLLFCFRYSSRMHGETPNCREKPENSSRPSAKRVGNGSPSFSDDEDDEQGKNRTEPPLRLLTSLRACRDVAHKLHAE